MYKRASAESRSEASYEKDCPAIDSDIRALNCERANAAYEHT